MTGAPLRTPLPWRPLRRAVLRAPSVEVCTPFDVQRWGYHRARDLPTARRQHARFCDHLAAEGVEVALHDAPLPGLVDALYVCDPALMTPLGAVVLRFGKAERQPENGPMGEALAALGVPIAGRIQGAGTVEGGDCLWLDEKTLAVGEGYRSNAQGIAQLRAIIEPEPCGARVLEIQLPYWNGPAECMHLQSLLSFVDKGLAVVATRVAPVRLVQALEARGVRILPLPMDEFASLGSNILCTRPGHVVMAAGNPQTARLLRDHRVTVTEMDAEDLMWIGTGGPTCLTFVLERG